MHIDPKNTGRTTGAGTPRPERTAPGTPSETSPRPPEQKPRPPQDQVDISGAARDLLESTPPSARTLDPAREREIMDRLVQGYYDRPQVQAEVLRRMADDLGLDASPAG